VGPEGVAAEGEGQGVLWSGKPKARSQGIVVPGSLLPGAPELLSYQSKSDSQPCSDPQELKPQSILSKYFPYPQTPTGQQIRRKSQRAKYRFYRVFCDRVRIQEACL
jgi:hypothetical protein